MPARKLKEFLDSNHVTYDTINHPTAYTASRVSEATHIAGKKLAKTVIVHVGDHLSMVVLPSNKNVDFNSLKDLLHEDDVRLATEQEFANAFPDCELGAMPPFGNLYGMDVFVSHDLTLDEEIAFCAGTHSQVIKLPYKVYDELVHPTELH